MSFVARMEQAAAVPLEMCLLAVCEKHSHAAGAPVEEDDISSTSFEEIVMHTKGLARLSQHGKRGEKMSSSTSNGLVNVRRPSDQPAGTRSERVHAQRARHRTCGTAGAAGCGARAASPSAAPGY